jgi:hypothetical protein
VMVLRLLDRIWHLLESGNFPALQDLLAIKVRDSHVEKFLLS